MIKIAKSSAQNYKSKHMYRDTSPASSEEQAHHTEDLETAAKRAVARELMNKPTYQDLETAAKRAAARELMNKPTDQDLETALARKLGS